MLHLRMNLIRVLALSATGAILVSCSDGAKTPSPNEGSADIPIAAIQGELNHVYLSVEEIAKDATAIAIIEIKSISNEVYEDIPFTIAQAVVRESIAGDLAVGNSITVGEMGGPIRGKNKQKPGEFGEVRIMATGGVHPMAEGEVYLMFFDGPGRIGPVMDGAFAPLGAFQGKIRLTESGKLDFDGADNSLSEEEYAVSRALDGRQWSQVKAEIQTILGTAR